MVLFYLDGEQITRMKAKAFYDQHCDKHWIGPEDAAAYWLAKSHCEEAREQINNITESLLEIVIED